MSVWSRLKALSATPEGLLTLQSQNITAPPPGFPPVFGGGGFFAFPRSAYVDGYFFTTQTASYAMIYDAQPAVRSVIDMLASNFVQVEMKLYEVGPDMREEDYEHPAAQSVRRPMLAGTGIGGQQLLGELASDLFVYDNAYAVKIRAAGVEKRVLMRIPPYSMGVRGQNRLTPTGYRIMYADGTWLDLEPVDVIHIRGYNPIDPRVGISKMETLRQELVEESVRQARSIDFWRGGGVKGGVIQRPLDAPEWSDAARERFEEGFSDRLKESNKGKSAVLEEGMTWIDAGVSPKEAEAIAARNFTQAHVARTYGLHPALFAADPTAAGAQLQEARKQLYEDVLPPPMKLVAECFTIHLAEAEYRTTDRIFVFDLTEKLEGNVIERYARATTAAGRPFMTVNEIRAEFGKPPIDGGDELVLPSNVVAAGGGLPAPNVMPIPDPNTPAQDGSHRTGDAPVAKTGDTMRVKAIRRLATRRRVSAYADAHTAYMQKYFERQRRSLGGGKAGTADSARWDAELSADLLILAQATVEQEGTFQAQRMLGTFDMSMVEHYLGAGAKVRAGMINSTTANQLQEARAKDSASVAAVFATAIGSRSDEIGQSAATSLSAFSALEAARQNPAEGHAERVKEWVWSGAANSRHGGLAGEIIPVGDTFSNGGLYPGDPALGVDQTAGCLCSLDVI